jgi:hypothetical protein
MPEAFIHLIPPMPAVPSMAMPCSRVADTAF